MSKLKDKIAPKNNPVNLLVATPAYGGWVHIDHEQSLIQWKDSKVPFTLMTMGNESLIPRGRNTCFSTFYAMKEFTHLLFLDADMGLQVTELAKLITHNVDIIGAPVQLKGKNNLGEPVYNIGSVENKVSDTLWEVSKVGTAIFMISRWAAEQMVRAAKEDGRIYRGNPHTRGVKMDIDHYDVFQSGMIECEYESEDFFFCHTARGLGIPVYIDPTVKNRHNGMYVFGGD